MQNTWILCSDFCFLFLSAWILTRIVPEKVYAVRSAIFQDKDTSEADENSAEQKTDVVLPKAEPRTEMGNAEVIETMNESNKAEASVAPANAAPQSNISPSAQKPRSNVSDEQLSGRSPHHNATVFNNSTPSAQQPGTTAGVPLGLPTTAPPPNCPPHMSANPPAAGGGHMYSAKTGEENMANSQPVMNWYSVGDASSCNMPMDHQGENLMPDGMNMNNVDSMVTDTSQLFAASYQVLEGEEDGMLPNANQHDFFDSSKSHENQVTGGNQMMQANFQNSMANSQNQGMPQCMPSTCSTGTGNVPTPNYTPNKAGTQVQPTHQNAPSKQPEPPKLAHPNTPQNAMPQHRASQPPNYPGMWPNQGRGPVPQQNRPQGNMPQYGSPVPPRSFPNTNYPPIRNEATQAKSFENQFSDFIRARHSGPYPPRGPNMQDPSRGHMSPNSGQNNFQSPNPNVNMNKFQNMNRYPFHQQLGPASGAIRDLACRVPGPQFPRGPGMLQGNMGHQQQPLQHQTPPQQQGYNQMGHQQQQPQQQQGFMGPPPNQWNQPHGNMPLNQHPMMSPRHSAQTPPHSQPQNYGAGPPHAQQQQLMQSAAGRNDGSPVPQIASPSLSQQAISNIPPIDPPAMQHRTTPEKSGITPKKKKSSPKISRESNQETVKMQEEKALLENPHANVHIGHPKGKKCKFHRTKSSKDKYTVFGCRACNVALCKECHDEYHNELAESHHKWKRTDARIEC